MRLQQYFLGVQQYFQYYQSMAEQLSCFLNDFSDNSLTSVDQNSQKTLKGFKPWVFKPKKVKYSLAETLPKKQPFSTAHWNSQQNAEYVNFLIKFKEILEGDKQRKRKWHLNRIMSKMVKTRSHEQCRSHHQKMMKHHKSIESILKHLSSENIQNRQPLETSREDSAELNQNHQQIFFFEEDLYLPELPLPTFEPDSCDYL